MKNNILLSRFLFTGIAICAFLISGCSQDNPVDSSGMGTSKVAGRLSTTAASSNILNKSTSIQTSLAGAVVILAEIQADGSLKTVSTQNVQTDASGKFVVETNIHGENNLVVIATQGATVWKAMVSSTVESGSTVYAPPLNVESTTATDLYIKLVAKGRANSLDLADLKLMLNTNSALHLHGDSDAQDAFAAALQAQYQAIVQASANSYFGLSASQIQAMMQVKAKAESNLDLALYNSADSDDEADKDKDNFQQTVLSGYANNNISASVYAELLRIGITTFINSSASMNSSARLALAQCFNKRYSFVLNLAMIQQFQALGASSAQMNAVASAGAALASSIKTAVDINAITNAYVQYHYAIKSQIEVTLAAYSSLIESLDVSINGFGSSKTILSGSISSTISADVIINAYTAFFNSVKVAAQSSLAATTQAQISAASQVLIMSNMN
ncbi:MAG: hypothetical protein NTX65_12605 [Ignavibacteriales bacterium]|nr:hypothetical protein [Ignavibacteriales bacterium]